MISTKLKLARRKIVLLLRGRIFHRDRFGLSYWLWTETRAMGRKDGEPGTDDTGVLEQLKRVYAILSDTDNSLISVDVGSYIGVITLAMAHFGPTKHFIYSFEADELNYMKLKKNICHSKSSSITIHKTAIANYAGSSDFTRYKEPGNNHLGLEISDSNVFTGVYKVPVTTLDFFTNQIGVDRIDVLKIDVEGFDFEVLMGAKQLLKEKRIKVIIVETPGTPKLREKMNEFLISNGFITAYIVRNSPELTYISESTFRKSDKTPLNMLAVRPDMANQLGLT
ncbi:MAG: FkbM family methyltransferase [Chloroflexota bacterium]|nr:FkbM family methyltransferase [Chloroflexota bacterium]